MIRVDNLVFSYNSKRVIDNVGFNIKAGEFFAVAGPNGAGKSTLIKLMGRIYKPDKGKIFVQSRDIWLTKPKDFSKIVSVVPQFPSYDFIKVKEFVALGRIPHFLPLQLFENKQDKTAVQEAMKICGVYKFKDEYISKISGGERQLVFLSRALSVKPKILILDEPLSNLDIKHKEKILFLLKDMVLKDKMTVVAVLHDLNIASEFADRLLLIKKGRVVACGKPSDILTKQNIKFTYETKNTEIFTNPLTNRPAVSISNL